MVGLTCNPSSTPVPYAHDVLRKPSSSIASAMQALTPPPLSQIPLLTDPAARPGQWVRYTAMVQDIWDMEIYVASSPDGQSGFLVENAAASGHPNSKLAERLPIYLVSIPGETPWARVVRNPSDIQAAPQSQVSASVPRRKRTRDDVDMSDITEPEPNPLQNGTTPTSRARPPLPRAPAGTSDKRSKPMGGGDHPAPTSAQAAASMGLNTPVPHQQAASAVVAKLYDSATEGVTMPKLNSVLEVVGILQDGVDVNLSSDDGFAVELAARNPRNVRRLHVLQWRQVSPWEFNPLTADWNAVTFQQHRRDARQNAHELKKMLVEYFTPVLLGDVLAAEYLVMALLSRPIRQGSQMLGKLSVNLALPLSASDSLAGQLIASIQNVCASVVNIDVSIANLNAVEMFPRKDYDLNRLRAGSLQLVGGSCLITNETVLSHGRLAERGVKNMRALSSVMSRGVAPIDFQFYESELEVECSTVLLSKGSKSVIGSDVMVRVCENEEHMLSVDAWTEKWKDEDAMKKLRLALSVLAEDGEFDISEGASDEVSKAYVEARKNGKAKDGQECLQRWLSVARACARMFGETCLSAERWRNALDMEHRREARAVPTPSK